MQVQLCHKPDELNTLPPPAAGPAQALAQPNNHGGNAVAGTAQLNATIETALIPFISAARHMVFDVLLHAGTPEIACQPEVLRQIWSHLFQQAVLSQQGKGYMRIYTLLDSDHHTLLVKVTDHGPGMQEEEMRLFCTIRPIIHSLKGALHVESEPGLTVVTVSLPYHLPQESSFTKRTGALAAAPVLV
ncbi:MAG: hypothetical protein KF690_08350 [Bacteroidetes bacterium]|nr:hypothetical protein [Bacteroidota bacterium]